MQQSNADKILFLLKSQGKLTAAVIAEQLAMTAMGARQHLLKLQQEGLVHDYDESGKVGRPKKLWCLTEQGHSRFPDRHSNLSVGMIDAVIQVFGESGLEQVIKQREADTLLKYQSRLDGIDGLEAKLRELVDMRSSEGYMAELLSLATSEWLLVENHCPICVAANACRGLCRSELAIFKACLPDDIHVERADYLFDGARRCSYLIKGAQ